MTLLYYLHEVAMRLHIVAGSCGLVLFWIPLFTHKGNLNHKRFGRYFARIMYTVGLSGLVITSLDLLFPLAMHARGIELSATRALEASREIRDFALFLLSLSLLVLLSTRQGWLSILGRGDRAALRQPLHLALCAALIVAGFGLLANGLATSSILFLLFGTFEIFTALGALRYATKTELRPKEWWTEHLGGLIASGIAAYTAFFVFGGLNFMNTLFGDSLEGFSIFLWIAPGLVGGGFIAQQTRKYRRHFESPEH
ncbi:MAG: hypothetical protein P1V29_03260 [Gammaproteobacteria bacterium]|jgi:hypothetical protein|nr:hypothetical protein [Gammaproteobacteria bacterium]